MHIFKQCPAVNIWIVNRRNGCLSSVMPSKKPTEKPTEKPSERATKLCTVCGRVITWRKKWARDWANVLYCSDACRRGKLNDVDKALEEAIIQLLKQRAHDATICPSDAARAVSPGEWEPLMQRTRAAARRLVQRGIVEITQAGRAVDASTAKGPIRLRKRRGATL